MTFGSLQVLIGEAHRRVAQSGTKYHICVDFSKANGRMHWPAHFAPIHIRFLMHCRVVIA